MKPLSQRGVVVLFRKQLGDLIIMQPALRALAEQGGEVVLLTQPGFAPLLTLMPGVRFGAPWEMRCAAAFVSFSPKFSAAARRLFCWSEQSRLVLTKQRQMRWWQNFFYSDTRFAETATQYRGSAFFDALAMSGQVFSPPCLAPPPESWRVSGLPANYVVIHPSSAWRRKSLSPEMWGKALAELTASEVGAIVLTGGSADWERELCHAIAGQLVGHQVIDLGGKTNLQGYLATLAGADAVFCVDSSASHAAQAFDVPTLTIFGPSNPLHWFCPSPSCVALSPPLDAMVGASGLLADLIPSAEIVSGMRHVLQGRE